MFRKLVASTVTVVGFALPAVNAKFFNLYYRVVVKFAVLAVVIVGMCLPLLLLLLLENIENSIYF